MPEGLIKIVDMLYGAFSWIDQLLKNFDPSLFQNIILGVLAIFIPFAIVFLTDILNSKNKETRSEFEKMVLIEEVLGAKKFFWGSMAGIIFFAFFTGTSISNLAKIFVIVVAVVLIIFFWLLFKKVLGFSEGDKSKFEKSFLKKLNFSKIKIFRYRNKTKAEKMKRAWNSFWSEKSETNERDFTDIFISHIDGTVKCGEFDLAVQLAQYYTNNIEKRDPFSIENKILRKVFKWNELFWKEKQLWLKGDVTHSETGYFSNWHYFGEEFFQAIIKVLLKYVHGADQLFVVFKKHVEEKEKQLDEIEDEKEKDKHRHYITGLFANFYPTFFDEINDVPLNHKIWKHHFPPEWKITVTNKDNRITLDEFYKWSWDRIFKKKEGESYDKNLTNVISGIFPSVDPALFTAFLMLFFSSGIKQALEKEPNFSIFRVRVLDPHSVKESKEDVDKILSEKTRTLEISQRDETIQIILKFFYRWSPLTIDKDNLSEEESKNWDNYTEDKKRSIVKRVRKKKLKKLKTEIAEVCKNSKQKKSYRQNFLELINLLLLEIEK